MCSQQLSLLHWMNNSLISKNLLSTMSFLFKYYPLAKQKSNTQKKLTLERVILATPSILSEKSETPFFKNFKNSTPPAFIKGSSNYELTIKIPEERQWSCSDVFIVNFEHSSHLFLIFLLLTLNKQSLKKQTKQKAQLIHLPGAMYELRSIVIAQMKSNFYFMRKYCAEIAETLLMNQKLLELD